MGYEQLLTHLVADYFTQSDWMALRKHKRTINCLVHVVMYTACFLILTTNPFALAIIGGTHFLIDRFQLVKYIIWAKNHLNPTFSYPPFQDCYVTGYYDDWVWTNKEPFYNEPPRQKWITTWLYIISDNTLHLICNFLALKYFA